MKTRYNPEAGTPAPIGATCMKGGVNFSLYSHKAKGIDLILFDSDKPASDHVKITLDPDVNKSTNYWHIFIPGLKSGQIYGYRIHGVHEPSLGLRFDPSKVLVDPYARAIIDNSYTPEPSQEYGKDNVNDCLKSVVYDPDEYDWEGDQPLNRPLNNIVIYEMHVAGFTKNPNSRVRQDQRGTYAGLIKKIPYLKDLGIQCVQLMPTFAFDKYAAPNGQINYWGYQPINFFAPHPD